MKEERRLTMRIAAALAALVLVICALSSCGPKEEEPEITRSAVTIIAPIHTEDNYRGEATTDPDATKNAATTAATKKDGTTAPATTADNRPAVTFENPLENEAISQAAANSGGTSAKDIAEFVSVMGYDYDPNQGIFYTSLDNWQRQGNFVAHYDTAAHYINMNYKTIRIDFGPTEGYNWRMQLWKGEYGVFGGCEAGIYTQNPDTNNMLYTGVDDAHMLQWESALYLNEADFKANNAWFYREWQSHWWLTGFKSGVVNPEEIVMFLHVRMRSAQMANQFEEALLKSGFTNLGSGSFLRKDAGSNLEVDSFKKLGTHFYIAWRDLGELNYQQRTGN